MDFKAQVRHDFRLDISARHDRWTFSYNLIVNGKSSPRIRSGSETRNFRWVFRKVQLWRGNVPSSSSHLQLQTNTIVVTPSADNTQCQRWLLHISLEQNLTIRSHDGGKEGHFCNCGDTSIHLPLTIGVPNRQGNYPFSKFTSWPIKLIK